MSMKCKSIDWRRQSSRFPFAVKELVEVSDSYKHRADKLDKKVHNHTTGIITEYFNPGRLDCLKGLQIIYFNNYDCCGCYFSVILKFLF